jgi:choline dehydrogenase
MGFEAQFDFIVVGGGTAGCVLANRLSESRDTRVCLIEAGPVDRDPFIPVPAAVAFTILNPKLGWGFKTVPQKGCNGRVIPLPRGRVLGGSSSINGMVYFRGHPGDFDDWAAAGAPGWSYAEVLPYFIKSENNEAFRGSPYHGTGGPMNVISIPKLNPLVHSFLEAAQSLRLKSGNDFNGADPEGFGPRQAVIRNGRRVSGTTAFLNPARSRPNLTIITDALTHRVVLQEGRAAGVCYEQGERLHQIGANREVIVSGGAYGSPTLLMLSGIGDGQELQQLGIPVAHHLPGVGKGLRDHPSAAIQMRTRNTTSYGLSMRKAIPNALTLLEYLLYRRGPIAGNTFEAHGFYKSDPALTRPDLQIIMMPAHRNAEPKALPRGHGYGIICALVKPASVGTVRLASADPHDVPLIDPNFLAQGEDLERILVGLKLGRRILRASAFDRYGAQEILPGPAVQSDEAWREYIRRTCTTVHHPTSTCRMGSDTGAVVDPELKVRGIHRLRVVDASVFPTLIAGNTNAAVVMVAEKASDMILGRQPPSPLQLQHAA